MKSNKWLPCPQCGDFVYSCEWGEVIEFYSWTEQTCTAVCSNCSFSIDVTVRPEKMTDDQFDSLRERIRLTWNALYSEFKEH